MRIVSHNAFRLLMSCMIVFACMPWCHGQSIADVLPESGLQNLGLGTTEASFVQSFPSATKGSSREGATQYWLPRSQGETLVVNFRNDHLASVSLSYSSLTPNAQQALTARILKQCRERYGEEQLIPVGKVVSQGAAKIESAVFGLAPSTSVIVQSSEVELSVTMADFRLVDRERVLIPFESVIERLKKSDSLNPESITPQQITDFIANAQTSKGAGDVAQKSDVKSSQTLKKAPEVKPTSPTPSGDSSSSTPWSIIVVLIVVASALLWLLLKGRK